MEIKENSYGKDKKRNVKSENGNGSFRMKDNGKIEYRISYINECGLLRRKSFTGIDEEECIDKSEEFLEIQKKKNRGIDMNATIPDLIKHRYDSDLAKNYVGEQGYYRCMETLKIIEKSTIGKIPIADLEKMHIDMFLRTLTHYSNSTIKKVYQQIRMGYSIAIDKDIVAKDITRSRDLRRPKSFKTDKKVRGLTEEEQRILVRGIEDYKVRYGRNSYKLQILIALYSGMRMGEINALKVKNVNFDKKIIKIENTISRGKDYRAFIKEGTKTYSGMREIPINKLLEPVLREAIANCKENEHGLIFYDYIKNDLITTSQVNLFFGRVCKKCGIESFGQHSLRHTFATRCIEAGVPPVVLKNWLGHKDIHITLETYADVFDKMNFGAMEKFEEHIKQFENNGELYDTAHAV